MLKSTEFLTRALLGILCAIAIAIGGWAVHRADVVSTSSKEMNSAQAKVLITQGQIIVRTEERVDGLIEKVDKGLDVQEQMRATQVDQGSKLDRILGKLDG